MATKLNDTQEALKPRDVSTGISSCCLVSPIDGVSTRITLLTSDCEASTRWVCNSAVLNSVLNYLEYTVQGRISQELVAPHFNDTLYVEEAKRFGVMPLRSQSTQST